jgi:hypothetical protein
LKTVHSLKDPYKGGREDVERFSKDSIFPKRKFSPYSTYPHRELWRFSTIKVL